MRYVVLMALASAGGVAEQAGSMCAISRYQGQPIAAFTPVWDKPVSESRSQNGPVCTLAGNTASTAVPTRSAMGFVGSTQASTKPTSSTPITIHCRLQLFTDTNKRVIGFKGDDANGARSSMFQQLSHQ